MRAGFGCVSLLVLAGTTGGWAVRQDRPAALFRSATDLVVLRVTVTDRSGAHVTGLSPHAFQVFDEARPQPVTLFTAQDVPATIDVVIDDSGSMREVRQAVLDAVHAFAGAVDPRDDIRAWLFSEDLRQVWPEPRLGTAERSHLRTRLAGEVRGVGRSAFHDALLERLAGDEGDPRTRRVVIVVGDGGDNASRAAPSHVWAMTRASDAVVYAIGLVDPVDPDARPGVLRRLARLTGGRAVFPRDSADLIRAFQDIASDIRHTYTLAYPMPVEGPRVRRVTVRVTAPERSRLTVRTRASYVTGDAG